MADVVSSLLPAGDMAETHVSSRGRDASNAVAKPPLGSRRDGARTGRYDGSLSAVWDTCVSSAGLRRAQARPHVV
jgi:hypothetical protein